MLRDRKYELTDSFKNGKIVFLKVILQKGVSVTHIL